MGQDARKDALNNRHAELEERLEHEATRPIPDTSVVTTLKRQKLRIKDEIHRMEAR
ncbi:YdcH family protein [Rhodospirillum rubrum]|uniref:YdcH family protein n=1 Tax=Rhodospirillum rubrum TaxID=1085 RepID=UPI000037A45F|nr:YdcH family protein [Rhodospirillum rubrum]MBK5953410.1 hypothetical protein [Rhodospirillum rubrum]QXG81508.1 YdcH family protein [Rhodospirillum rubrum]HAQ01295.1 DUF465 domain-containing protein [Rhodospirillum rubrum]HCF19441.1 DUF465 domain-containing protein [Rhodospirillum rubrum]